MNNTLTHLESVSNRISVTPINLLLPPLKKIAADWGLDILKPNQADIARKILIDNDVRIINDRRMGIIIFN